MFTWGVTNDGCHSGAAHTGSALCRLPSGVFSGLPSPVIVSIVIRKAVVLASLVFLRYPAPCCNIVIHHSFHHLLFTVANSPDRPRHGDTFDVSSSCTFQAPFPSRLWPITSQVANQSTNKELSTSIEQYVPQPHKNFAISNNIFTIIKLSNVAHGRGTVV